MRQRHGTRAGRRFCTRAGPDPPTEDPVSPGDPADETVKDHVKMLLAAVLAAVAGLVLLLLFATVFNLYKGTRAGDLRHETAIDRHTSDHSRSAGRPTPSLARTFAPAVRPIGMQRSEI